MSMQILLPGVFFVTALLYSTAGFGGGSTYSAVLSQTSLPRFMIPLVSLPCNIVVSGTGFLRLLRSGEVPVNQLLRITLVSVPSAFLGGLVPVSRRLFILLLGILLLYAGVQALITHLVPKSRPTPSRGTDAASDTPRRPFPLGIRPASPARLPAQDSREQSLLPRNLPGPFLYAAGTAIGFVSGITGIGGGIVLSPLLWRYTSLAPRAIAGMSSGFILLNSLAGLSGQIMKSGLPDSSILNLTAGLVIAVALGGQIGSRILTRSISVRVLGIGTGSLLVAAAIRLMGM